MIWLLVVVVAPHSSIDDSSGGEASISLRPFGIKTKSIALSLYNPNLVVVCNIFLIIKCYDQIEIIVDELETVGI